MFNRLSGLILFYGLALTCNPSWASGFSSLSDFISFGDRGTLMNESIRNSVYFFEIDSLGYLIATDLEKIEVSRPEIDSLNLRDLVPKKDEPKSPAPIEERPADHNRKRGKSGSRWGFYSEAEAYRLLFDSNHMTIDIYRLADKTVRSYEYKYDLDKSDIEKSKALASCYPSNANTFIAPDSNGEPFIMSASCLFKYSQANKDFELISAGSEVPFTSKYESYKFYTDEHGVPQLLSNTGLLYAFKEGKWSDTQKIHVQRTMFPTWFEDVYKVDHVLVKGIDLALIVDNHGSGNLFTHPRVSPDSPDDKRWDEVVPFIDLSRILTYKSQLGMTEDNQCLFLKNGESLPFVRVYHLASKTWSRLDFGSQDQRRLGGIYITIGVQVFWLSNDQLAKIKTIGNSVFDEKIKPIGKIECPGNLPLTIEGLFISSKIGLSQIRFTLNQKPSDDHLPGLAPSRPTKKSAPDLRKSSGKQIILMGLIVFALGMLLFLGEGALRKARIQIQKTEEEEASIYGDLSTDTIQSVFAEPSKLRSKAKKNDKPTDSNVGNEYFVRFGMVLYFGFLIGQFHFTNSTILGAIFFKYFPILFQSLTVSVQRNYMLSLLGGALTPLIINRKKINPTVIIVVYSLILLVLNLKEENLGYVILLGYFHLALSLGLTMLGYHLWVWLKESRIARVGILLAVGFLSFNKAPANNPKVEVAQVLEGLCSAMSNTKFGSDCRLFATLQTNNDCQFLSDTNDVQVCNDLRALDGEGTKACDGLNEGWMRVSCLMKLRALYRGNCSAFFGEVTIDLHPSLRSEKIKDWSNYQFAEALVKSCEYLQGADVDCQNPVVLDRGLCGTIQALKTKNPELCQGEWNDRVSCRRQTSLVYGLGASVDKNSSNHLMQEPFCEEQTNSPVCLARLQVNNWMTAESPNFAFCGQAKEKKDQILCNYLALLTYNGERALPDTLVEEGCKMINSNFVELGANCRSEIEKVSELKL